jgi:GNAT superfamily N-acetyltransferase
MTIRKYSADDASWIVQCMQNMRREIEVCSHVEDDFNYVLNNLLDMSAGTNFIGLCDDTKDAFIIGCLSATWYDKRIKAYEQLLYVAPECRTSSLGSRLITEFCKEAKARGAVEIIAGTSLGFKRDAVVALYKRKGFTPMGESLSLKIE